MPAGSRRATVLHEGVVKTATKATITDKASAQFLQSLRQPENAWAEYKVQRRPGRVLGVMSDRVAGNNYHVTIRGFLSHLYEKGLGKTSVARALAAVRSLYRWLARKAWHRISRLLQNFQGSKDRWCTGWKDAEIAAFPQRDLLMLDLLYSKLRLTGINLEDIRLVPRPFSFAVKAGKNATCHSAIHKAPALAAYLPFRLKMLAEQENFLRFCSTGAAAV